MLKKIYNWSSSWTGTIVIVLTIIFFVAQAFVIPSGSMKNTLLINAKATVTVCNSRTKDLKAHTSKADIVIIAVGVPYLLKEDMVKDGAIVIDVGINRLDTGKLVGDADFEGLKNKCSFLTPVPGGVGPMTIAMLLKNTIKAANLRDKREIK